MKTSLSSLHKCDKCELNFLSKEGMEKHCARVHQVQTEAALVKFNCDRCEDSFKSKSDMTKHSAAAKTVGGCAVCQKSGTNPKFSNICEFTRHRKNHERKKISDKKATENLRATEKKEIKEKRTEKKELKEKRTEDKEIKEKRRGSRMKNYAEDSSSQLNVEIQSSKKSNVKRGLKELNETEDNKKKKHSKESEENWKKPKLGIQILESRSKIVTIEKIPDARPKISTVTMEENAKEMLKSKEVYFCNLCPKSFPTNLSLTMHKNIHFDEKPFKCIKCEKTFAQKGNLRVHMYRNHGFIQEERNPEENLEKADTMTVPVVPVVKSEKNGSKAASVQPAASFPQLGVALLRQTVFHYPTFSWAQLVEKGIIGEDANLLPIDTTKGAEVEEEEGKMEMVKEMEVREMILPPNSSAGQQIIGF